jgi:hypothetical protein
MRTFLESPKTMLNEVIIDQNPFEQQTYPRITGKEIKPQDRLEHSKVALDLMSRATLLENKIRLSKQQTAAGFGVGTLVTALGIFTAHLMNQDIGSMALSCSMAGISAGMAVVGPDLLHKSSNMQWNGISKELPVQEQTAISQEKMAELVK